MYIKLVSLIYRIFFIAAVLLLFIALWEWIARFFGYTLSWSPYEPGKLLEFSAICLIFVITFLLRQIREEFRNRILKKEQS